MNITPQTLLAADLADRWIDAILSQEPGVLLHADSDEPLTPEDMASNLAQFRATLIEELSEQPIDIGLSDEDMDDLGDFDALEDLEDDKGPGDGKRR